MSCQKTTTKLLHNSSESHDNFNQISLLSTIAFAVNVQQLKVQRAKKIVLSKIECKLCEL